MADNQQIHDILNKEYKLGFETLIQSDTFEKGLNEDVIRAISAKKEEPELLLEFRLKAYEKWLKISGSTSSKEPRGFLGAE